MGYDVAGIDLAPSVETLRSGSYRGKVADVTEPAQLTAAVDELLENLELRHVVGLAGRVLPDEAGSNWPDVPAAVGGFSRSVSLNLTGQFALICAALPKLDAADGDRSITLCSSVNALRGFGAPAYSGAKAGLIGMMHALATPLGGLGIRINVVAPGTTRTPLLLEEIALAGDAKLLERKAAEIPLGRVAEPEDVAPAIESAADRLTYVTDEVIKVDGGQLLARPVDPPGRRTDRWRRRIRRRLHNRPFR